MSATAYSTGLLRRYDFRRFHLGLARSGIYAAGVFAVTVAVTVLARASVLSLPSWIGSSPFGALHVCTIVFWAASAVWLAADPRKLMMDTLRGNTLNLYYKLGGSPLPLALVRPTVILWGFIRVYLSDALLSVALGYIMAQGSYTAGVAPLLSLALAGICGIIILTIPALFAGMFVYYRAVSTLVVLASGSALFLLLRVGAFFDNWDGQTLANAVSDMASISPLSLSVVAAAVLLVMGGSAVAVCSVKLRSYDEEELDDDDLVSLGVTKDIAVYERTGDHFSVVISGPEVNGFGDKLPDIEAEPCDGPGDGPAERGGRANKKKRGGAAGPRAEGEMPKKRKAR